MYSRGTGGLWLDDEYRTRWVAQLEGRFPSLTGRIATMVVPGGVGGGTFREPQTTELVRQQVEALLGMEIED